MQQQTCICSVVLLQVIKTWCPACCSGCAIAKPAASFVGYLWLAFSSASLVASLVSGLKAASMDWAAGLILCSHHSCFWSRSSHAGASGCSGAGWGTLQHCFLVICSALVSPSRCCRGAGCWCGFLFLALVCGLSFIDTRRLWLIAWLQDMAFHCCIPCQVGESFLSVGPACPMRVCWKAGCWTWPCLHCIP